MLRPVDANIIETPILLQSEGAPEGYGLGVQGVSHRLLSVHKRFRPF